MNSDKNRYEASIDKYRSEKKKLTKLCKALEEDLLRKDQDLRKIHSTLKDLQSIPLNSFSDKRPAPSSSSSQSSMPVAEVLSPNIQPPKPPSMLSTK